MLSLNVLRLLFGIGTFILFLTGNFIGAIVFFGLTLLVPEED